VLSDAIEQSWNDADELHRLIHAGVEAGLGAELVDGAKRLLSLEDGSERAVVLAAIALARAGHLDEGDAALREFIDAHGETGVVLTNLAKLQAAKGDEAEALAMLEHALEIDPDQANALAWWVAMLDNRDGRGAGRAALASFAERVPAWRPRLILADLDLELGDIDSALSGYREVLRRTSASPDPVSHIAARIAQIRRPEILVDLLAASYDAERHDPKAGILLAQALQEVGRELEARDLQRRVQVRHAAALAEQPGPSRERVFALPVIGPIWAAPLGSPEWLVPRAEGRLIAIAGFANLTKNAGASYLARAIPLSIAELVRRDTHCETLTLLTAVEGLGPFTASERWTLPSILDLTPPHLSPDLIIAGTIERGNSGHRAVLEIFDPARDQVTEMNIADAVRAGPELVRWLGCESPSDTPSDLHLRALDALARLLIHKRAEIDAPFRVFADLLEHDPSEASQLIAIAALLAVPKGTSAEHEALVREMLDREQGPLARLAPLVQRR